MILGLEQRRRRIALLLISALIAGGIVTWRSLTSRDGLLYRPKAAGGAFLVAPYVQLGALPPTGSDTDNARESLTIHWQADDQEARWAVESRSSPKDPWRAEPDPTWRRDPRQTMGPRRFYRGELANLDPGARVDYRVKRNGVAQFEATAQARKSKGQPHRFVAFGDGGADSWEQMAIAYRIALARPDYVMVAGDIVYYKGRLSEYLDKFFPIYNSDRLGSTSGAPLLRSIPMMVAPGNHDLIERNLERYPDALAYFLVWSLPLNGPLRTPGQRNSPVLSGSPANREAFLELARDTYPRMANYSFDYGDVHWTVLDTNIYADWNDPVLSAWLEADLTSARDARWRILVCHQPPFHSSGSHAGEQQTRILAERLQKHGVDLVISGHIHNYQRTRPLRFTPEIAHDTRPLLERGIVKGQFTLDKTYDGITQTRPDGIIYLVTGAGGARLYDTDQHGDTSTLEDFTVRFVSNVHSMTVVDVEPDRLSARQIDMKGNEVDRFILTKPPKALSPPGQTSSEPTTGSSSAPPPSTPLK